MYVHHTQQLAYWSCMMIQISCLRVKVDVMVWCCSTIDTHAGLTVILPGLTWVISQFPPLTPLPLLFNTIPPCPSPAGGEGRGKERKYILREVIVQRFRGQMSFLSPNSAKDIQWNSSFLQLPTDSYCNKNNCYYYYGMLLFPWEWEQQCSAVHLAKH